MNNKKLFYKTVIALLLLLNGVCWLDSVETFFYDYYDDSYTCKIQEFTPPEGVQWATLDNHPLGSIIAMREHYHITRSASHVLTEQEKEVIVQNKNALNMLYSVQMGGVCKFLNVYSMLAFNEKDLDFLFE